MKRKMAKTLTILSCLVVTLAYSMPVFAGEASSETTIEQDEASADSDKPINQNIEGEDTQTSNVSDLKNVENTDADFSDDENRDVYRHGISGNIKWILYTDGLLVISGSGNMNDYSSTTGYSPWYVYRDKVENVVIKDGVTTIGNYAFYEIKLNQVSIADSVTSIRTKSFYGCKNLKEITIPQNVAVIQSSAFCGDYNLEKIEFLGETVIGVDVFYSCKKLTEIIIPDGNKQIYLETFMGCDSLKKITIPDSVTTIDKGSFVDIDNILIVCNPTSTAKAYAVSNNLRWSCINHTWPDTVTIDKEATCEEPGLKSIHCTACDAQKTDSIESIPALGHKWNDGEITTKPTSDTNGIKTYKCQNEGCIATKTDSIIANGTADNITWDINADGLLTVTGKGNIATESYDNNLWHDYKSKILEVSIDSRITGIGYGDFAGCDKLKSVELPSGLRLIDTYAFSNCKSLGKLVIPESVSDISSQAFEGCTSLTEVTIPDGLEIISQNVFKGCTSLTEIMIPDSVEEIEDYAFYGCSKLKRVTILGDKTYVGSKAFKGCGSNLTIICNKGSEAYYFAINHGKKWECIKHKYTHYKKPGYLKKMTGYQIRYSIKSSMSGAKYAYASKSSKSKRISKLGKKKTYYVQVRNYMKKSGTTYYSSWSSKKSVKTE